MIKTNPYRAAVLGVIVAAAAFGLSLLTSEGDGGQGWTDGSQGISNASWILMILSIAFAVVALVVGVIRGARTND